MFWPDGTGGPCVSSCSVNVCTESVADGTACDGVSGDLTDDLNPDGGYCSASGGGFCCAVGSIWGGSSCSTIPGGCNPAPCLYDFNSQNSQWWGSSACISAGSGCCRAGIQAGQMTYDWENIDPY